MMEKGDQNFLKKGTTRLSLIMIIKILLFCELFVARKRD